MTAAERWDDGWPRTRREFRVWRHGRNGGIEDGIALGRRQATEQAAEERAQELLHEQACQALGLAYRQASAAHGELWASSLTGESL